MLLRIAIICLAGMLLLAGCQTPSDIDIEDTNPSEKKPIEQIDDTIQGFQGGSVFFKLSEYYRNDSPIKSADFYSDSVLVEPLEEDTFQVSQPEELFGEYIIESVVTNSEDQVLESMIIYMIDPKENDTTDTDSPEPVPPSNGVMVIMPLGDSMTNDSRPRVTLWNLLTDDGHELDYVGDQHQTSSIPDPYHEGVGGIKIQGIIDKTEDLMERHQPEYVLLMVGTNDIAWYFDETAQEIADRWNKLIQLIFDSSDSETYIVAATIPPVSSKDVGKSNFEERDRAVLVKEFNEAFRAHIKARKDRGENIEPADMEEALHANEHLANDGVHLNEEGYRVMGTVYYNAVNRVLMRQN